MFYWKGEEVNWHSNQLGCEIWSGEWFQKVSWWHGCWSDQEDETRASQREENHTHRKQFYIIHKLMFWKIKKKKAGAPEPKKFGNPGEIIPLTKSTKLVSYTGLYFLNSMNWQLVQMIRKLLQKKLGNFSRNFRFRCATCVLLEFMFMNFKIHTIPTNMILRLPQLLLQHIKETVNNLRLLNNHQWSNNQLHKIQRENHLWRTLMQTLTRNLNSNKSPSFNLQRNKTTNNYHFLPHHQKWKSLLQQLHCNNLLYNWFILQINLEHFCPMIHSFSLKMALFSTTISSCC